MATFTKAFHRTPYPSILPTRPGLSQKGNTVLITGSAAGIGFAIARAFIAASPTRVIILSRRPEVLAAAKTKLESTKVAGSTTEILTTTCDIADTSSVEKMWAGFNDRGITVDVLVLNAVAPDLLPSLVAPGALETIKRVFDTNVFGNLSMTLKFFGQGVDYDKVLINISSVAVHWHPHLPHYGLYSGSKTSFTSLFEHIAEDTPVENAQMLSIHPGAIFTPSAAENGLTKDSLPWDSEDLPAFFAVWAASKEAAFLHGRFVWAHWDVEELKEMEGKIRNDPGFLTLGLQGVEHVDPRTLWDKIRSLEDK